MSRHKPQRRKKFASLFLWHRYLGLTAALLVLVLSVTGLLLNHTSELGLDQRYARSDALLNWYGIRTPENGKSFAVGAHWVSLLGTQLFWDDTLLDRATTALHGAVALGEFVVIGADADLLLLTADGELVERLDGAAGVPAGLNSIGLTPDKALAIYSAHGFYQTDTDFAVWHETDTLDADWASPTTPPAALTAQLASAWRGHGLPLERVVLDLHSGRIAGPWGVYLMDAAAVVLLFLAFSGVWVWWRRRVSTRKHRAARERKTRHH